MGVDHQVLLADTEAEEGRPAVTPLTESAGESLGTAFALLLAVSVIGTVRRSCR